MMRIKISNMHCGGCAKRVKAALEKAAPGMEASVDLERREVTVTEEVSAAALVATLRGGGWQAEVLAAA